MIKQPLRIHLGIAFTLIVLLVGGLTGWMAYDRTSAILAESGADWTEAIGERLESALAAREAQVRGALKILAQLPGLDAGSFEQRLHNVPAFAAVLEALPGIVAVYAGHADGEYFLLRRLRDQADRQRFTAPEAARYLVQSIEHDGNGTDSEFLYLDAAYAPLERRARPQALSFDPRSRPWYLAAVGSKDVVMTEPYRFFTSGLMGTSLALRLPSGQVTLGVDLRLDDLAGMLRAARPTPGARLALFAGQGRLIAIDDPGYRYVADEPLPQPLVGLAQEARQAGATTASGFELEGAAWQARLLPVVALSDQTLYLALAIPEAEILSHARTLLRDQTLLTLGLLACGLTLGLWLARRISQDLRQLAAGAEAVRRFDFTPPPPIRSRIREVDQLASNLAQMRSTLARFLEITQQVAAEDDLEQLLADLLRSMLEIASAQAGVLYLTDSAQQILQPAAARKGDTVVTPTGVTSQPIAAGALGLGEACASGAAVAGQAAAEMLSGFAALGSFAEQTFTLAVPLRNRHEELVGALLLFGNEPFALARVRFIERLSGFASVTLEARELIRAQKALFDAFVQLLAGAIDAKSAHTGGHCERVPQLLRMLAEAACAEQQGPFAGFQLDPRQWEAVHLAGWLHDCGKVTTPEYVVDKATRLETLYDRIHEIRTRFEVLKQELRAGSWQAIAEGADRASTLQRLENAWRALDQDFAFVAECNSGEVVMDEARRERLLGIAAQSWTRTLDDSLGLGAQELQRRSTGAPQQLPVREPLLADRPEQRIPREDPEVYPADLAISLRAPELLYNRGELANLCIARGTLTEEERYKINEHIIQTILMLARLPFPAHLTGVPEMAGSHHERMDGRGYPRGLPGDRMSPVARMLAIADVYEALTASDRPYKPEKSIDQALAIMGHMAAEGHIDPELFGLFQRADIPRRYATWLGRAVTAA